ncbi:MAG: hypothetical protein OQK09_14740 [Colwellia sp.]|nr:hypothetical protein [Colwellia sp.]MCW8863582.1 hypothetical protein [Colwellia sp.]MCW9082765.1 hypothetical protein [Colwellia sp.]
MIDQERSFEAAGSVEPPGIIGRIVRFILGYFCLDLFIQIVNDIPGMIERGWPINFVSMLSIILGFYLLRPVINIGFTLHSKFIPQFVVAVISVIILVYQWLLELPLFGFEFTVFLMFWMSYVFGHLGISFVVAAIIRTPGCEMRGLPHLWSKITGKKSLEHYCPGPLAPLDRWEKTLKRN